MEEYEVQMQPKNESALTHLTPLSEQPVHILVTDADIKGQDVSKMSDFMSLYVEQQTTVLAESPLTDLVKNFPIADVGILNEVIQQASGFFKSEISLLPDFEHLPKDIREKLKKGIYKIGDSKQVDGNLRPVILDEKGVRIKDITLKRVVNNPDTIGAIRSISNQLQMKQINDKLVAIQEMQNYLLDKDRDHAILKPFFSARDQIGYAQNAETLEERNSHLQKASEYLIEAKNEIIREMRTAANHLAKYSKHPIFSRKSSINTLTSHIADDIQMLTKVCGIQMQVQEYLGNSENARIELEQFQTVIHDLLTLEVGNSGYTAIELVHDNFKYNDRNRDCWYIFSKELESWFEENPQRLEAKEIYIVSLEDVENACK